MGNSTKPTHLSVVEGVSSSDESTGSSGGGGGGGGFEPGKIISVEQFTPAITEVVQNRMQGARLKGVITGALVGDSQWDLRPLVLLDGRVQLLRYLDQFHPVAVSSSASEQDILAELVELGFFEAFGKHEGHFWVVRCIEKELLSTSSIVLTANALRGLVSQVASLHDLGLIHGHISLNNVAIRKGALYLLDPLLCVASATSRFKKQDLAPELKSGASATYASDSYGLGLILREVFGSSSSQPVFQRFLDSVCSEVPTRRPTLEWIDRALRGKLPQSIPADFEIHQLKRGFPKLGFALISLGIAITFLAIGLIISQPNQVVPKTNPAPISTINTKIPVENYWSSGQVSLMRQVAELAVLQLPETLSESPESPKNWGDTDKNDSAKSEEEHLQIRRDQARLLIIQSAQQDKAPTQVLSSIIKISFDPRWEGELTEDDRLVALKASLGSLLSKEHHSIMLSEKTHPAVLLALVGSVKFESMGDEFNNFSTSQFAKLPSPIGPAFTRLSAHEIKTLDDPIARALSHIAIKNIDSKSIETFLTTNGDLADLLDRLRILKPFLSQEPTLGELLFEALASKASPAKSLLDWFRSTDFRIWQGASHSDQIAILLESLPKSLNFEQLGDLLSFPLPQVRELALNRLISDPNLEALRQFISSVSKEQNSLTRSQSITLLTAMKMTSINSSSLQVPTEESFAFIKQWFETNPDKKTIAVLLANHKKMGEQDPFVFEACGYLSANLDKFSIPLSVIEDLIIHPEPLARTIGYLKLNPENPDEQQLLIDALRAEPNQRIQVKIRQRLGIRE